MPPLAAMAAPVVASHVADRYFSAERVLAFCHLACAALMLWLHELNSFWPIVSVYFLYGCFFVPTFGLTNTVALHHSADPQRDFARIRLWGTVGWCVVAWAFGYGWLRGGGRIPDALLLSAGMSLCLGLYSLSFRPAEHYATPERRAPFIDIFRVYAKPSLLLLCFATVLNNACHQFYYFAMGPYLSQAGFRDEHIMPAMSLGQFTEIILMAVLGWFLLRIGMKRAMIAGVCAQTLRFILFSMEGGPLLNLAGISLHGLCYTFYFTTAYLYVDQHSTPRTRAGAQQLLTIMIAGPGALGGYLAAGATAQYFSDPTGHINFHGFWWVPALLSCVIAVLMLLGFREESVRGRES